MSIFKTIRRYFWKRKVDIVSQLRFDRYKTISTESGLGDIAMLVLIGGILAAFIAPDYLGIALPPYFELAVLALVIGYIPLSDWVIDYITLKKTQGTTYLHWKILFPGHSPRVVQIPIREGGLFIAKPESIREGTGIRYIRRRKLNPLDHIRFGIAKIRHRRATESYENRIRKTVKRPKLKMRKGADKAEPKYKPNEGRTKTRRRRIVKDSPFRNSSLEEVPTDRLLPPKPLENDSRFFIQAKADTPEQSLVVLEKALVPVDPHKQLREHREGVHPVIHTIQAKYYYGHNKEMGIDFAVLCPASFNDTFAPVTGRVIEYGQEAKGVVAGGTVEYLGKGTFVDNELDMRILDVFYVVDSAWHSDKRDITRLVMDDRDRAAGAVAAHQAANFAGLLRETKIQLATVTARYEERERNTNLEVTRSVNQEQEGFIQMIEAGLNPQMFLPWYKKDIMMYVLLGIIGIMALYIYYTV